MLKSEGFWKKSFQASSRLVERLEAYALQYGYRRLRLQASGRWYVALVIVLGVAAIASANNILYLLESFLLGGLILSGILSEYAVASIELRWRRGSAVAGEKPEDELWVRNEGRIPILCIEVGEWKDQEFRPLGFSAMVPSRSQVRIPIAAVYPERGQHQWEGLAVQTSYPFGFASKLRWIDSPGRRIIWPSPLLDSIFKKSRRSDPRRGAAEWIEGEVRPASPADDMRGAIWRLAIRGGDALVRPRGHEQSDLRLELELQRFVDDPEGLEAEISRLASHLYALTPENRAQLVIRHRDLTEEVEGKDAALDRLATLARPVRTNEAKA